MAQPDEKTVLIVDDEPDVRSYLSRILEDAGFRVLTAADGEEALRLIRERKPDFISLDLVMPNKTGHKLLYELRKDRHLARIPVLIVTAHARDDMGKGDLKDIMDNKIISGPSVYLEKPVRPRDYVRCVRRALGIETPPDEGERHDVRDELEQEIRKANPAALRQALEALKKRRPEPGTPPRGG
jgi:two-component system alkaline phosphatase synthesis response regulator PhoP